MWTKVTPKRAVGAPARTVPAVQRPINDNGVASAIFPDGWAHGPRCDVYSDGNGRLAFKFGERGEYKVGTSGPKSRAKLVTIPSQFRARIPYGTTDVMMTSEGGMYVLDLNAIRTAPRVAAE